MMCKEKNLKKLLKLVKRRKLFSKKLKLDMFLCIVEIMKNICSKGTKCQECFTKPILKQIKKKKGFVRELLNEKISERKRKKVFVRANQDCQNLINTVLDHFFENCVESCAE